MEKFPEDVEIAERLTRQKISSLFINDRPDSIVKAILGQPIVLTGDDSYSGSSEYREKRRSCVSLEIDKKNLKNILSLFYLIFVSLP